jgi:hypothetical protein
MKMPLLVEAEAVVGKKIRPYSIKSECYVQVITDCIIFVKIVEQDNKKSVVCAKDKKSI